LIGLAGAVVASVLASAAVLVVGRATPAGAVVDVRPTVADPGDTVTVGGAFSLACDELAVMLGSQLVTRVPGPVPAGPYQATFVVPAGTTDGDHVVQVSCLLAGAPDPVNDTGGLTTPRLPLPAATTATAPASGADGAPTGATATTAVGLIPTVPTIAIPQGEVPASAGPSTPSDGDGGGPSFGGSGRPTTPGSTGPNGTAGAAATVTTAADRVVGTASPSGASTTPGRGAGPASTGPAAATGPTATGVVVGSVDGTTRGADDAALSSPNAEAAVGLALDRPTVIPGGDVMATGRGCQPGAAVAVTAGPDTLATATAEPDGSFRSALDTADLAPGHHRLQATCGSLLQADLDVVLAADVGGAGPSVAWVWITALVAIGLAQATPWRRVRRTSVR
jgi:hypothetical protein